VRNVNKHGERMREIQIGIVGEGAVSAIRRKK
jgi:hypothetical protein